MSIEDESDDNGSVSSMQQAPEDSELTGYKGPFQLYFEDVQNVKPKEQMKWIFMVSEIDASTTMPFSEFYDKKGYKMAFLPNKTMYGNEIKRRNPSAKINMSNKRLEDLKKTLDEASSIDDPQDMAFIQAKVEEYTKTFQAKYDDSQKSDGEKQNDGRRTSTDRLRFILAFEDDVIIRKYRQSQEMCGQALTDARNSENRESNFFEAIADKCNDDNWVPKTKAKPSLHDDFKESFE